MFVPCGWYNSTWKWGGIVVEEDPPPPPPGNFSENRPLGHSNPPTRACIPRRLPCSLGILSPESNGILPVSARQPPPPPRIYTSALKPSLRTGQSYPLLALLHAGPPYYSYPSVSSHWSPLVPNGPCDTAPPPPDPIQLPSHWGSAVPIYPYK